VETGRADQWVLKRREFPGFAIVNEIMPTSLRYPLSVFKKNSTLEEKKESIPVESIKIQGKQSQQFALKHVKGVTVLLKFFFHVEVAV
jgi:hypothetical protein